MTSCNTAQYGQGRLCASVKELPAAGSAARKYLTAKSGFVKLKEKREFALQGLTRYFSALFDPFFFSFIILMI